MREVWLLEDSDATVARVQSALTERSPQVTVRSFGSWVQMEAAWQNESRPAAIILDLLVPEKHIVLAKLLLMRNASGWKGRFGRLIASLLWFFVGRSMFPELLQISRDINVGNPSFGGINFLHARIRHNDLSIPVYVYSIAANEEYDRYDPGFAEIALEIRKHLHETLMPLLANKVKVFAKGFYVEGQVVHDRFSELFSVLNGELSRA